MSLPKLLIFLAVWRRPEITEICFMGIDRLRRSGLFPIEALAVISEDSMIPLCKKYSIDFCMYKNLPLGEKKNYGLSVAMGKSGWDYLLEIGSDDVLKNEILELYKPLTEQGIDFFGIKHFYYLNSETGECRRLQSDTTYGAARCISRKAIECAAYGVDIVAHENLICPGRTTAKGHTGFFKIDAAKENEKLGRLKIISEPKYRLWRDDLTQGLDNNSTHFLMTNGIGHRAVKSDKALGIDIKSKQNIWPYNKHIGVPADLNEVLEGLSENEKSALFNLMKKQSIERQVIV